jgi:plasmid stability protein
MCRTCKYPKDMPTMIQLRHVPDDLHRKLKSRAAMEGMSLSDYVIREIRQIAEKPTMSEMMERLARRKPVNLKPSPTEMIRALRDGLDRD